RLLGRHGTRVEPSGVPVTPKDGTDFGTAVTSDVATVANTAPVATNVVLNNTAPTTGQTISVSHDYSDADLDSESGTTYQWQKKVDRKGVAKRTSDDTRARG